MRDKLSVGLSVFVLLTCVRFGICQQIKVSPELWKKAEANKIVHVIVKLDVPWRPTENLTERERRSQQERIVSAQKQLRAELAGTNHRVTGEPRFSPSIGLDVGPDALAVLERSSLVTHVTEDVPVGLP